MGGQSGLVDLGPFGLRDQWAGLGALPLLRLGAQPAASDSSRPSRGLATSLIADRI